MGRRAKTVLRLGGRTGRGGEPKPWPVIRSPGDITCPTTSDPVDEAYELWYAPENSFFGVALASRYFPSGSTGATGAAPTAASSSTPICSPWSKRPAPRS